MSARRFAVLSLIVLFFAPLFGAAQAEGLPPLPHVQDLQKDAREARERNLPLLVMFSTERCPFCEIVEGEFLRPMLLSGQYEDKVIMRKVKLGWPARLRDFDGKQIDNDVLASRYSVFLTPTVVMLDPQGELLAPKLVGIVTADFYGGDLDKVIDTALEKMRPASVAATQ